MNKHDRAMICELKFWLADALNKAEPPTEPFAGARPLTRADRALRRAMSMTGANDSEQAILRSARRRIADGDRVGWYLGPAMRSWSPHQPRSNPAPIRAALERAGAIFTNGEEPGAKLRKPDSVTPEQCRQARHLLGISQQRLARLARTCQATVSLYERTGNMSVPLHSARDRVAEIRAALEQAGVVFGNENGEGLQVRLGLGLANA